MIRSPNQLPDQPNNSTADHHGAGVDDKLCVLHMLVPVGAKLKAKLAAIAAGLPFRTFVAKLLWQADELPPSSTVVVPYSSESKTRQGQSSEPSAQDLPMPGRPAGVSALPEEQQVTTPFPDRNT